MLEKLQLKMQKMPKRFQNYKKVKYVVNTYKMKRNNKFKKISQRIKQYCNAHRDGIDNNF